MPTSSKRARPKKSARPSTPAARRAKAARPAHPLPPGKPLIPCDDPFRGKQFEARVNCKIAKNKRGKQVKRCDRQRVVVVGCASPTEDRPRARDLFVVQAGDRYTIPDREIRRDLRASGRPAQPARKQNHHGGYHEPGDPLGVYMPPLRQWRQDDRNPGYSSGRSPSTHYTWRHPSLPLTFDLVHQRGKGTTELSIYEKRPDSTTGVLAHGIFSNLTEAYDYSRQWYADLGPKRNGMRQFKIVHHDGDGGGTVDTGIRYHAPTADVAYRQFMSDENANGELGRLGRTHYRNHRAVPVGVEARHGRDPFKENGVRKFAIMYNDAYGRSDTGARYDALTEEDALREYMEDERRDGQIARLGLAYYRDHRAVPIAADLDPHLRPFKENRAPVGAVPGQTYVDGRADPLLLRRVSGERYKGLVRVRAVGCDGRTPSHVVGGHVLRRSRVAAGIRREEIRLGLRPAPARRGAPRRGVIDATEAPTYVEDAVAYGPAEPTFRDLFGGGGEREPLRPRPPAPAPVLALPAPAAPPAPGRPLSNEELVEALRRRLARKPNRRPAFRR